MPHNKLIVTFINTDYHTLAMVPMINIFAEYLQEKDYNNCNNDIQYAYVQLLTC